MKFLITGAAGFIGSNLVDKLLCQGHSVLGIDNFSTGDRLNLAKAVQNSEFELLSHDLSSGLPKQAYQEKFDWIIHLAANVGVERVVSGVESTLKNNLGVTQKILGYSREKRVPILFSSTSEIYGKSAKIPMSEDDDRIMGSATRFRWAYAETKVLDELLLKELWLVEKIPTIVVRLFNTVGPRQTKDYGMVLPRFIYQAKNNLPITIYGDGTQTRSFCHVNDVIEAMLSLILEEESFGKTFNVGSPSPVTIYELANIVCKLAKWENPRIEFLNPNKHLGDDFEEIPDRLPDISRINALIGWNPKQTLEEIIIELLS